MKKCQLEERETAVLMWISKMRKSSIFISNPLICQKTKAPYEAIHRPNDEKKFSEASDWWLMKFKHHHAPTSCMERLLVPAMKEVSFRSIFKK